MALKPQDLGVSREEEISPNKTKTSNLLWTELCPRPANSSKSKP